jgi:hypothetical protein
MATTTCGFVDSGSTTGAQLLEFFGPTLIVDIGFDPAWYAGSKTPPNLGAPNLGALVDTGAAINCIDSGLAAQLQLPVVNQRMTAGPHGAKLTNIHMAQVHIPTLDHTILGEFAGADLIAGGQPHHALIGRPFLRNFIMIYEGPTGNVVLESR